MDDYKQQVIHPDRQNHENYEISEKSIKKAESEYKILLNGFQNFLFSGDYIGLYLCCEEILPLLQCGEFDYILQSEANVFLNYLHKLIQPDNIIITGIIGFKLLSILIERTQVTDTALNIDCIIQDLPHICDFLLASNELEFITEFLILVMKINFAEYEKTAIEITSMLLNVQHVGHEKDIILFICSLVNTNINIDSLIGNINEFLDNLLNKEMHMEEIFMLLVGCSFDFNMGVYNNLFFINFINQNLQTKPKEILNFLTNLLIESEDIFIHYNISYKKILDIVLNSGDDDKIEYYLAFMNCYINNTVAIYTYDDVLKLIYKYIETKNILKWTVKLLYGIHITNIIMNNICILFSLDIDVIDDLMELLFSILEYDRKYSFCVIAVFREIKENNIICSHNALIDEELESFDL